MTNSHKYDNWYPYIAPANTNESGNAQQYKNSITLLKYIIISFVKLTKEKNLVNFLVDMPKLLNFSIWV